MTTIKAIGFDFGGVIEGEPGSFFEERASSLLDASKKEFQKAYFKHNQLRNNNQITNEEFWQRVLVDLGKLDKLDDFMKFLVGRGPKKINVEVLAVVDSLRAQGYKVCILSNNVAEAREMFETKDIPRHFDAVLISAEIGHSKPHAKAFELLFEELGCQPHECIFIDDTEASLSSAQEIGFHPILFVDAQQLKQSLRSFNILL